MKLNEKKLFKELCKFKSDSFDESLLSFATPNVLGQLFFNRMQGVAFGVLKKHGLLGKVNREFRNSLQAAYEHNAEKNLSFLKCVETVADIISDSEVKAAMLKGAYLCAHYPIGYRTSNDIDLLVLPQDVTEVGKLLSNAGFKQGNVRNGEFIPASRKEIIESKMLRGETVPYIKEVNLPYMKYLEVDINFSLDYKNGETDILSDILASAHIAEEGGISIPTLAKEDFFLHLCAHLHKEATTLPWIEMKRDMTFYKYCDIYMLLSEMTEGDIMNLFARARELGLEKICAYAIAETSELFDIELNSAIQMSQRILSKHCNFRLRVADPKAKRTLIYKTKNAADRFFTENRAADLKEEKTYEKT